MTNYLSSLAAKLYVFADGDQVKHIYFATPFGIIKRTGSLWLAELSADSVTKEISGMARYEVDWAIGLRGVTVETVPLEHEIVRMYDLGSANISNESHSLIPSSEAGAFFGQYVFVENSSTRYSIFDALEAHDYFSAIASFKKILDVTPDNESTRAKFSKYVQASFLEKFAKQAVESSITPRAIQFAHLLGEVARANSTSEWVKNYWNNGDLRTLGHVS